MNLISSFAFHDCTSLESIGIPPSITRINNYAFKGCEKLKEVTFQSPHQLRTIHDGAFENCLALEEIMIPQTVTGIPWESFKSCENLKKVDFCGGSPAAWIDAFDNCRKLDYSNIIANGKLHINTFRRFAWADLSRRISFMTGHREAMIKTKLSAIPNQIVASGGRITQSMKDSLAKVYSLVTCWELKESTTILELAI